jgi:hypothetical protein
MRIVQETLTNVRKHAQAQTVRVLLTREPGGEYVLLVEDDGVGFSKRRRRAARASTSGCRSWRSGRGASAPRSRSRASRGRARAWRSASPRRQAAAAAEQAA